MMRLLVIAVIASAARAFRQSAPLRGGLSHPSLAVRPSAPLVRGGLSHPSAPSSSALSASPFFEPVASSVESYVNIWVPLFASAKDLVPDAILKWGHGSAMLTVLVAMGGIGVFLGYQVRAGNGEATYPVTLGKTAREQHPVIMSLMTFFFLLGGQGGLVLLAARGEPILESSHALSAIAGLSLLAVQASLPLFFERGGQTARTAHAVLGTSTMVALGVHAVNGINLGLSL